MTKTKTAITTTTTTTLMGFDTIEINLVLKKTPIISITNFFFIFAIMAKLVMAINMAFMGVYLERSKNADQTRKTFVNWSNGLKVRTKDFEGCVTFKVVKKCLRRR